MGWRGKEGKRRRVREQEERRAGKEREQKGDKEYLEGVPNGVRSD